MAKAKITVLLIEDDPMVQEVNRQFVERVNGFKVIDKADNGKEGMKKIKELKPDLVLLDVFMPTKDGLEVLYQIRKGQLSTDVIAITAASDSETIKTMLQNGAVDYIVKPFKFERIKKALENYRDFRGNLSNKETLSQEQIDQMLMKTTGNQRVEEKIDLPKGLNNSTLKQIKEYISRQSIAQSAEDVAEGIGIARVTARRYLEYLKETGQIELSVQYGTVGRPVNRYMRK
ncbi:response regulator [Pseudalkalibacillus caeni]|uniref:Transcriptional regulatory protein n=1 Tax=Exobacillus caeni TaxID=2574798 RepID=A0A5R9F4L4_9BACL|nr:response regulator [Pseudalkalibacillus caeni]TLS36578.1 response regulator [Pseudalkalibacillus caeni]